MATYETLKAKADKLLRLGDSLGKTDRAESRRLLRLCRHYRRLAKEAKSKK
jgi:hypothetical protein